MWLLRRAFLAGVAAACALAAAAAAPGDEPFKLADTQLEQIGWGNIEGWADDYHLAAFATYRVSCQPFLKVKQLRDERPIYGAQWEVCRRAAALNPTTGEVARKFFEDNF